MTRRSPPPRRLFACSGRRGTPWGSWRRSWRLSRRRSNSAAARPQRSCSALSTTSGRAKTRQSLRAQRRRLGARIAATAGEHDKAEQGFKRAVGAFRELAMPFWLAVTLLEYGEWLATVARAAEASRCSPRRARSSSVSGRSRGSSAPTGLGRRPRSPRARRVTSPTRRRRSRRRRPGTHTVRARSGARRRGARRRSTSAMRVAPAAQPRASDRGAIDVSSSEAVAVFVWTCSATTAKRA